jgi:hypothetical protein
MEGGPLSKENGSTRGFFDTLQSRHGDRRATVERCAEAHERRSVEARYRDSRGEDLEEGRPGEDRPEDHRVTPARGNGSTGCSIPWSRARHTGVAV